VALPALPALVACVVIPVMTGSTVIRAHWALRVLWGFLA